MKHDDAENASFQKMFIYIYMYTYICIYVMPRGVCHFGKYVPPV